MTSTTLSRTGVSPDEALEIAVDAYLYAFPLVLMETTRRTSIETAPLNQFQHARAYPDATFTAVVRPNADTLYSTLFFDVTDEPLLVSVPDSGGRYYLLPMLDMWTDVFASPGSRTTGNEAQTFAIVASDWYGKLPRNVDVIRAPTPSGWLIGRTQTDGPADYANVYGFQSGLQAMPLSVRGKLHALSGTQGLPSSSGETPLAQVAGMDAAQFFSRFAGLAGDNPPHANDYPVLARMRRIGIAPGRPFLLTTLSPEVREAIDAAPRAAMERIKGATWSSGPHVNGWRIPVSPIGTYGTDYTRRAGVAYYGLGANTLEDAMYPAAAADIDGAPFDAESRYVAHFEPGQLPPVRAFWSLTMYNDHQLFADNAIGRYVIGSRDALEFNEDGSLDIYIQRPWPGDAKDRNWLPTPASGSFSMNLRLYWPKASALEGKWKPPVVRRV